MPLKSPSEDSRQVLAHSWRETDRFVPSKLVRPIQSLMAVETSSAIAILIATVAALLIANTGLFEAYEHFWETEFAIDLGDLHVLELSLHAIVNDGLMTLFFLLVSLEIKREMVFGELRDPKAAALPIVAAVGGMIVPALIYVAFNLGTGNLQGWGIPMATDIAFAVALLAALGSRVPLGARLFLLTLAIVDDLGAILVIAVFYSGGIAFGWLAAAAGTVAAALVLQKMRVRALSAYIILGVIGWYALHESGVHATIIGVAFGLVTPAFALLPPNLYPPVATQLVSEVVSRNEDGVVTADEHEENDHTLREIRRLTRESQSPLHRIEKSLTPWVAFGIVPLFAFANAGVPYPDVPLGEWLGDPVVLGIALGLVLGKTLGIFGAAWLTEKTGLGRYPSGMTPAHLLGVAMTAGIGFTVAIFIANLAFSDVEVVEIAKLGILVGSLVAAVLGYLILRLTGQEAEEEPAGSAG
ncbi:MAG TPA: Na+/H+ antiporter NhaA [Nocardioidaceae bacterium]|nr:Na+/H+ antiporter NhaA [Nocardioidaceae bacterium]